MFLNYFKIAIRNLLNKKIYSAINLLGLSIGTAFCLLVYLYIQYERSFDTFHEKGERLYRLEAVTKKFNYNDEKKSKGFFSFLSKSGANDRNMISHPCVLAGDIKNSLPEVEAVVRAKGNQPVIWVDKQAFNVESGKFVYADKNFFTVFDFPLIKGNPSSVLQDIHNVVINERTAKRFFGNTDPIGKTINFPEKDSSVFVVAGVAKDFPANSSIDYDIVAPMEALPGYQEDAADRSNNHFSYLTFLLLKKNINVDAFKNKLAAFSKDYFAATVKEWRESDPEKKQIDFQLTIRPYADVHYNVNSLGHYTNLENIYELVALAIIIVLLAAVNYILLTLTNTVSRSQEVGIRKTMGAERKHVVLQFLMETQILVLVSIIGGLVLCVASLPLFNSLTDANIDLRFFSIPDFFAAGCILFIVLGVVAGFYPAFVMSGMKPLNMLRKFSSVKMNPFLSKTLVVAQYSACILLIISSLVISRQMKYINTMNLGFDKDQVVVVENPYEWGSDERKNLPKQIGQYATGDPVIAGTTFSNSNFGTGFNFNSHIINDKREMITQMVVDFNYFDFMNIKMVKGRSFSKDMPTDSADIELTKDQRMEKASAARHAIVVNETLYNMLGQPPLDEINRSMGGRIIGVCQDYQFINSTQKILPTYHMIRQKAGYSYLYFKIKKNESIAKSMDKIKSNWDKITAKQPFSFSFMDEEVAKSYESYTKWLKIINIATLIAVVIACMGLFGLSAIFAMNKTKEIGIRKVMGASLSNIFVLLNKDVIKLALISFIIAVPLALYFMNNWLQNFAYRIELNWIFFGAAGCIGLLLAIVAVSYHSLKAASVNPVKSLRTE